MKKRNIKRTRDFKIMAEVLLKVAITQEIMKRQQKTHKFSAGGVTEWGRESIKTTDKIPVSGKISIMQKELARYMLKLSQDKKFRRSLG